MPLVPNKARAPHEAIFEASHLRLHELTRELAKAATPEGSLSAEKADKTRNRLLAILRVLEAFVEDITVEQKGNVAVSSHASGLLTHLISAIDELRYGIVDPILERNKSYGKTKLPKNEAKRRQEGLHLYKILGRKGINVRERYKKLMKLFGISETKARSWIKNTRRS